MFFDTQENFGAVFFNKHFLRATINANEAQSRSRGQLNCYMTQCITST